MPKRKVIHEQKCINQGYRLREAEPVIENGSRAEPEIEKGEREREREREGGESGREKKREGGRGREVERGEKGEKSRRGLEDETFGRGCALRQLFCARRPVFEKLSSVPFLRRNESERESAWHPAGVSL